MGGGPPQPGDTFLTVFTYIGIFVSIVSLLITIATYLLVKYVTQSYSLKKMNTYELRLLVFHRSLRSKDQGQLLLMLCFALLGLYIVFIVAGYVSKVAQLCVIISGLVQYFMLVTFLAMLAEAINLYMKLVVVLGSQISHYVVKAYIVCWREKYLIYSNMLRSLSFSN